MYIWRTAGDSRVSAEHAANDGKRFTRDNPPPTGHPGQRYGCRCVAEEYSAEVAENANQDIQSGIAQTGERWKNEDFVEHFYLGLGRTVSLEQIGHLNGIREYYFYHLGAYDRINRQIVEKARTNTGSFTYSFDGGYDFDTYVYSFGGGTVKGRFDGSAIHHLGAMEIEGDIHYTYSDVFTDPASIREVLAGDSDMLSALSTLPPALVAISEMGGAPYKLEGRWRTRFYAKAYKDRDKSRYKWDF